MANKWAIQNGNWSDGSTWNDGVVPTADDDVWLNGKTLTLAGSTTYTIELKSLNTTSSDFSVSGGNINSTYSTFDLVCDVNTGDSTYNLITGSYAKIGSVTGNIHIQGTQSCFYSQNNNYKLSVVGNITIDGGGCFNLGQSNTIDVTGDVVINNGNLGNDNILSIIGNLVAHSSIYITRVRNINVSGTAEIYVNQTFYTQATLPNLIVHDCEIQSDVINTHRVEYYGEGYNFGLVTPRINPISGQLDFHRMYDEIPDYPLVTDVKKGVKYGYNEYEGVYEAVADYPQEANVLKGVEYDDGNKTGTLEVIALSGATAQADNISVVNLTEQQLQRVGNCATVSTVQKCFEDFKE